MSSGFVVENIAWYLNKNLKHDPYLKFSVLAKFLSEHGLIVKNLVGPGDEILGGFAIYSHDLTDEGMKFMRGCYQKWIKAIDRGLDPRDVRILENGLLSMRASVK